MASVTSYTSPVPFGNATLWARGDTIQAVAIAGGWRSMDMVIHYFKKTERERVAVTTYLK